MTHTHPIPSPLPHFRAELTSVLANQGIDHDGHPLNFLPAVTSEAEGHLTGLVVMSASVDADKTVELSTNDTRVKVPFHAHVLKGHNNAVFGIAVTGFFNTATDVEVRGVFQSFFPAPAKILTIHIGASIK